MNIPKDNVIFLSFINTKLRDYYKNLDECCEELQIDKEDTIKRLETIDYRYDEKTNQFI